MAKYISLLRGINVSGQKIIKMQDLKALYLSLGFDDVQTYIQSGNVVFSSNLKSAEKLATKIEAEINRRYGFDVNVLLRKTIEIEAVINNNPFCRQSAVDETKLYVTFLLEAPVKEHIKKLRQFDAGDDQIKCVGREVYLYCPNGYARTKLSNVFIEKQLHLPATTRNWKTVNKLYQMSC